MIRIGTLSTLLGLLLIGLVPGCVGVNPAQPTSSTVLYQPQATAPEQQLLLSYAPWFEVEDYQEEYNRIGAAAVRTETPDDPQFFIDTSRPAIYTQIQKFTSEGNDYTNLIYRVHFPAVPWPHLTEGRNGGLLLYVTLNAHDEPVLITIVHTCGCFLTLVPTSNLPRSCCPPGWQTTSQEVYGETLPGQLELKERIPSGRLVVTIRSETHRVRGLGFKEMTKGSDQTRLISGAELLPMSALDRIPLNGTMVSFFEKSGWRKGYVKGSHKTLERLFMGWWALDPRVGEDKALGPPEETGTTFYTSLKFWARAGSDIWNFPEFLNYWGWRLAPVPDELGQPLK